MAKVMKINSEEVCCSSWLNRIAIRIRNRSFSAKINQLYEGGCNYRASFDDPKVDDALKESLNDRDSK